MSRQFNRPVEFDPSLYQSINRSSNPSAYVSQHQYLSREQVLKNEFGLDNEEEKESTNQSINGFDQTGDFSEFGFSNSEELSVNQSNANDEEIERLTEQCAVYQRSAFVAESNVARLEAQIESINQTQKQARTMLIKQFKDQISQLLAEIDEQKQMLSDDDETISQLRSALVRFDSGDDTAAQSILQAIDPAKVADETRAQQREILDLKAQIKRLEQASSNQSQNPSKPASPSVNQSNNAEQINKLESLNQSVSQSLEKSHQDLESANQSIKQLNQTINQLKKDLSSKDQSISQLNQSVKQLEQANKQLEITNQVSNLSINQLTEQSKQQSTNQSATASNEQAINQLKQSVSQLTTENSQLRSNLDSRTKELEICKQSITQLQQTLKQASEQSTNQSTAQAQDLSQKLMNEQLANQSMKHANEESLIKIQSLNETIAQLQQSVKHSNSQSEIFNQRERQLENQIAQYKLQLESVNQTIAQSNQSAETYQAEVQSIKEKAKEKLAQASQSIKQLKSEYVTLRTKYESARLAHQQAISQSSTQCIRLSSNLQSIKQSNTELRSLIETMNDSFIASLQPYITRKLTSFTENLSTAYRKEVMARKALFNQLQEMKGNIRVYCRVRPQIARPNVTAAFAANNPSAIVFKPSGDSSLCSEMTITNPEKKTTVAFEFDGVFQPSSTQVEVFDEVSPLINSVMDGFNVCMFAYGQTGSGKSHTMQGPSSDPGVNIRSLERLFAIAEERSAEWEWSINISLIEIYNEKIHDLLVPNGVVVCKANLTAGGMVVQDLTYVSVETSAKVLDVLQSGSKNRKVSATAMNADSSRSHLILSVYVSGKSKFGGKSTLGKLHLIDLAGSERIARSGVTGDGLKEAQAINSSLSALGNVISARANKAAHVPYRDSTLTYLLQDSLEKNSKTLMFVQVSPDPSDASESICSLRFAERVRKVELGKATANVSGSTPRKEK